MKKLFAISLVIFYINSNTEFHELMRVPILLEHFTQHKKLVGDISIWEFLAMHYNTNEPHDADDNKLPFKDTDHSFIAASLAITPSHKIILIENTGITNVTHLSNYQEALFTSPLSDIFQPPKIG
ncbi:MAG: hypothetical protein HC846_02405 [Blastocatellia bacterium]|nr:hypothetical protein [Blastocatellia bacterium]